MVRKNVVKIENISRTFLKKTVNVLEIISEAQGKL